MPNTKKTGRPVKETATPEVAVNNNELLNFLKQQTELISSLKAELDIAKSQHKEEVKEVASPVSLENIKEKYHSSSVENLNDITLPNKVSIRQYLDTRLENMGLTAQGMSSIDGEYSRAGFKETMGYTTRAGVKYYLTGFEDHCHNIKNISDPDERKSALNEVSKVKKILEDILQVDLSSTNYEFWKKITLDVRVPIKSLNLKDPADLLTYYAIIGGGLSSVAPSKEAAENSNILYKYYLHIDTIINSQNISIKRLRNKAIAKLEELYENSDSNKLYMIAKTVLPVTKGFTKKDNIDRLYNDLHDYIQGVNVPKGVSDTPKLFINAAKQDIEYLTTKAVINDAIYHRFLKLDEDRFYYNTETFTKVGKSAAEVLEFYKNPVNTSEFEDLLIRVQSIWNN